MQIDLENDMDLDFSDLDLSLPEGFEMDFDDMGGAPKAVKKNQFKKYIKKSPRLPVRYSHAVDFVNDIIKDGLPEKDEAIFAIISGNFIMGDFFEAFLRETGLIAEEIIFSTLALNRENVDSMENILKYMITTDGKMALIVSAFWASRQGFKKQGLNYITENLIPYDGFYFAIAGIHTKITLIKTTCGRHFVFSGSANLQSSGNVEQIEIIDSEILYNWNRETWIAKVIDKYQAHGQKIRRKELWDLIKDD